MYGTMRRDTEKRALRPLGVWILTIVNSLVAGVIPLLALVAALGGNVAVPGTEMTAMLLAGLGIGVIGAGRVGAVLGAALRAEGHAITGAYAVSDASRERAAELLPGVPLLDVPAIVERSEMLLLAVPDDQLAPLAAGIAAVGAEVAQLMNDQRAERDHCGGARERRISRAHWP